MNDKPGSMLLHAYACGRIGVDSKTGSAGFAAFGASVGVAGLPDISTISAIVVRGNCRVVVCMDRRVVAASRRSTVIAHFTTGDQSNAANEHEDGEDNKETKN